MHLKHFKPSLSPSPYLYLQTCSYQYPCQTCELSWQLRAGLLHLCTHQISRPVPFASGLKRQHSSLACTSYLYIQHAPSSFLHSVITLQYYIRNSWLPVTLVKSHASCKNFVPILSFSDSLSYFPFYVVSSSKRETDEAQQWKHEWSFPFVRLFVCMKYIFRDASSSVIALHHHYRHDAAHACIHTVRNISDSSHFLSYHSAVNNASNLLIHFKCQLVFP